MLYTYGQVIPFHMGHMTKVKEIGFDPVSIPMSAIITNGKHVVHTFQDGIQSLVARGFCFYHDVTAQQMCRMSL